MTTVGIRVLKMRRSEYVNRVRQGEEVVVTDRGKPVARLEPVDSTTTASLKEWAERHGVAWQGGKPRGIPLDAAPVLGPDQSLAEAVVEDR